MSFGQSIHPIHLGPCEHQIPIQKTLSKNLKHQDDVVTKF